MAAVSEIREAIALSISDIGVLAYSYARDAAVPPEAQVGPIEIVDYDYTMARGCDKWLIPIRLYVGKIDEGVSQQDLDDFLAGSGSKSIKQAVEAETRWATLDPVSVRVMQARDEGEYRVGGAELLGVEFICEVVV